MSCLFEGAAPAVSRRRGHLPQALRVLPAGVAAHAQRDTTLNLRRKQRIRLDLAGERYCCKLHNARLLLQWGNTEWHDVRRLHTMDEYTKDALESLLLALQLGRRFFWLALLLIAKICVLLIALRLDVLQLLKTPSSD
jgi:hypothetical protein